MYVRVRKSAKKGACLRRPATATRVAHSPSALPFRVWCIRALGLAICICNLSARFFDVIPSFPIVELSFTVTLRALLPPVSLCASTTFLRLCHLALPLVLTPTMLTHRSCVDCGRQVRLSIVIQPPRCPACRLPSLQVSLEVRPCSRCSVPIPTNSSDPCCRACEVRHASDVICRHCGNPFLLGLA
jgi:hypothetical protein